MQILFFVLASIKVILLSGFTFHHSSLIHSNLVYENRSRYTRLSSSSKSAHLGKIAVSGIGEQEEDEFLLALLNEQHSWSSIVLGDQDVISAKKRFLTRTARYSGLLNILDFKPLDKLYNNKATEQLTNLLTGCDTWLAFNISRSHAPDLASLAVQAGIRRAIFTVELAPPQINDTVIPELDEAALTFEKAGGALTSIRHGTVVPGREDQAYEIVNATVPCVQGTVARGVLARVAAELLTIKEACGKTCGLSSSNAFAWAYLNILRSTGLTRQQEVQKIFNGGIQRVTQLAIQEKQAELLRRKTEIVEENKREKQAMSSAALALDRVTSSGVFDANDEDSDYLDYEEEHDLAVPDATLISNRANEILVDVWAAMNARMMSKSTSRTDFFETNMAQAVSLATQELRVQREKQVSLVESKKKVSKYDQQQQQKPKEQKDIKTLDLKQQGLQERKKMAGVWVRYVYLLLQNTMHYCTENKKMSITALRGTQQRAALRTVANMLRAHCNLPRHDTVYEPSDAVQIVRQLEEQAVDTDAVSEVGLSVEQGDGKQDDNSGSDTDEEALLGEDAEAEALAELIYHDYGDLLSTVPALKATKLVLDMSVETLRLNPSTPAEISSSAADNDRESSLIPPEIIVRDMGRVKRARGRRNGPLAQV